MRSVNPEAQVNLVGRWQKCSRWIRKTCYFTRAARFQHVYIEIALIITVRANDFSFICTIKHLNHLYV